MKAKKGSIGYYLLLALEKTAEGLVLLDGFSYSAQRRALLGLPEYTKKSSIAQTLRRLRKRGLIEQEKDDEGKIILKLTALGNDFLGKEEKWDGKYRIVIWDIPEKKRRVRDLFRRRLRGWGFKHWQKSVWVSKGNVADKLRKLVSDLEMEGLIAIIESDDPTLHDINFHDRGS